jgi:hypothetical protein
MQNIQTLTQTIYQNGKFDSSTLHCCGCALKCMSQSIVYPSAFRSCLGQTQKKAMIRPIIALQANMFRFYKKTKLLNHSARNHPVIPAGVFLGSLVLTCQKAFKMNIRWLQRLCVHILIQHGRVAMQNFVQQNGFIPQVLGNRLAR